MNDTPPKFLSPAEVESALDFSHEHASAVQYLVPLIAKAINRVLITKARENGEYDFPETYFIDSTNAGFESYAGSLDPYKRLAYDTFNPTVKGSDFRQEVLNNAFREVIEGFKKTGWRFDLTFTKDIIDRYPPKVMKISKK